MSTRITSTQRRTNRSERCLTVYAVASLLVVSAINLVIPSTAQAYDEEGGYFRYIVSPQICKARYESQERYLVRSGNAQVRNIRSSTLQVACPLERTYYYDRNGACDTEFVATAKIRLRPGVSSASARLRLTVADDDSNTKPGAFKDDTTLTVAGSGWDGSSTYAPTRILAARLDCIQKDSDGADVNLGSSYWVPSALIYLPSGAQLRRIEFFGGENAP